MSKNIWYPVNKEMTINEPMVEKEVIVTIRQKHIPNIRTAANLQFAFWENGNIRYDVSAINFSKDSQFVDVLGYVKKGWYILIDNELESIILPLIGVVAWSYKPEPYFKDNISWTEEDFINNLRPAKRGSMGRYLDGISFFEDGSLEFDPYAAEKDSEETNKTLEKH